MPRVAAVAVVAVLVCLVAACSGSGDGGGDGRGTPAGGRSSGEASGGGAADDTTPAGSVRRVAVVADSEVPPEVAELLHGRPEVDVVFRELHDGATMAQLDPHVTGALGADPEVLLYAGGTNDLPQGPQAVLDGLAARLPRYARRACVVMAVPVFRYERGAPEEVAERTAGTRVLERHVAEHGAQVVSYLDVSLAMDEQGLDFFAEGELGELHPGEQAHGRIAEAIAREIARCPEAAAGP
jgi:hypothetical protein